MRHAITNETYQKLVESMNEAVWMGDKNHNTIYANPKFCELTGYKSVEIKKMNSYSFWDKETIEKIKKIDATERKSGLSSSYEGRLLTKEGKQIPVLISGTPLSGGGSIAILTDLRNLKKKEDIYKRLVEHMNEAVWMGDKNEVTVYANPKFCELMEYSLEEMLGRKSYDFWDEKSAARVKNVNKFKRKKGISSTYEGKLQTKSGKKIPVFLSGTPLADGGTIGIMTDLRDLKEQKDLYKRLVEHMNEAVWMGDKNEVTIYANPKFCELMEYSLEEMLGRKSYDFWDVESAQKVKLINQAKRKKGVSSSYEGALLTKSGKKIPVLLSGTPLADGGTIGIMTDLRKIKRKEEAEKILSNAVQNSNDAIVVFNNQEEIISWNKGAKILFGYKKDEIINVQLSKIFSKKEINFALKNITKLKNLDLEGKHKNKKTIKIAATVTPIYDNKKKKVFSYLLIGRDISEQTSFEEELALKYQKIREAYDKLGLVKRQTDYLLDLIELCNETNDKTKIADFIVTSIIMLTQGDACVLRKYNAKKDTLNLLSSFGVDRDWRGKAAINFKNCLTEKAYKSKMPLRILDVAKEHKHQSIYLVKKNNLASLLLIPLIYKSKLVGSLSLYADSKKKLEVFENAFIEKYCRLVSLVLGRNF